MDSYTMYIFIFSRNAGGQGLPLACLLPSMVCIAVLCYVADQQPELIGKRVSALDILLSYVDDQQPELRLSPQDVVNHKPFQ